MQQDEKTTLSDVKPEQHFTQPPPRYTEASLVKKLEELGIGRPSTYASIISVLQERDYVNIEKKRFIAADRGRIVTAFLTSFFTRYVEYDFTANLEEKLDHVSAGDINWKELLEEFWTAFYDNVNQVKERTITEVISELNQLLASYLFEKDKDGNPNRKCPSCDDGEVSLKLGKFGSFLGCSHYPECKYTKQLGKSDDDTSMNNIGGVFEAVNMGIDPNTGEDILLKKGPYGFYVQLGEDPKAQPKVKGQKKAKVPKPKRASLPKGRSVEDFTLEDAIGLLALPRLIGTHPDTGKEITASIGRFGPYLKHDDKFTSLKDDDILQIGINRAVTVIEEAAKKGSRKGATKASPTRIIGKHPKKGDEIAIYSGRYGPYIKYNKKNIAIPKDLSEEEVTIEQALELIDKKTKKSKKTK